MKSASASFAQSRAAGDGFSTSISTSGSCSAIAEEDEEMRRRREEQEEGAEFSPNPSWRARRYWQQ